MVARSACRPLKFARCAAEGSTECVGEVALVDASDLDRHRTDTHLGVDQELRGAAHPTVMDVLMRCQTGCGAKLAREMMRAGAHEGGQLGHADRSVQVADHVSGDCPNLVSGQGIRAVPARTCDRAGRRPKHVRQPFDQFFDVVGLRELPVTAVQASRQDGRGQKVLERARALAFRRRCAVEAHGSERAPITVRELRLPVLPNTRSQKEHVTP